LLAIGAGVAALLLLVCGVLVCGVVWLATSTNQLAQKREGDALVRKSADEETGDAADRNAGEPDQGKPAAGLKPGKPIDEKQVQVPTKSRFNAKNVNETADWVIARTLEINQQRGDNAFRVKTELNRLTEQMQACVGQKVQWNFTVADIQEESVRFHQSWSTFDGSRYPDDPDNRLFKSKSLIIVPRFRVELYHEGKELFDRIRGPNGGDGMRGRIDVPGTSLARQEWCDDGLVISDEIGDKQAAALKPNEVLTVTGKIKAFRFVDDLSAGFPSACAVCTLEADRTEESKRERNEQMERLRRAQERLEKERLAKQERDWEESERLAREAREEEKRKRAAAIEHYWEVIYEWQEEVRRTGKEPSGQWQKQWQEKWAPIPRPEDLYPAEAIAELREEDRRVGTASKEWRKKWREKWEKVAPNP
jgi:hypothetical protein